MGAALAAGTAYLGWRIGWTRDGARWWLFWPLWLAELTVLVGLLRMSFEMWTLRSDGRSTSSAQWTPSVDAVVICRDEPIEVLRATLLGCMAIRGEHSTIVLDTLGRADLAKIASELGAQHLAAQTHLASDTHLASETHLVPEALPPEAHLKGIIGQLDSDLVTVLHGDDVPLPNLIEELVGDFDDPRVWLAQGRQASYAATGDETGYQRGGLGFFFSTALPGKNHHRAAYWCGSGGLVRTQVLREAMAAARNTDTPTFEISMRAHGAGWRSRYHDETVVLTLSGPDIGTVVEHHSRWARGNLRALLSPRSALFAAGLDRRQRMAYAGTAITYLGGPRRLAMILVLTTSLLSGALPLVAEPALLLSAWATWMGLHVLARRILTRDGGDDLENLRDEWMLLGAHCAGWALALLPRSAAATLRRRHSGGRELPPLLGPGTRLLGAGALAALVAAMTRLLANAGLFSLPALSRWALGLELAATAALVVVASAVVRHIHRDWRRSEPRFAVRATADLGDSTVPMLDVSENGASVALRSAPRIGSGHMVGLLLPGLDGRVHRATVAAKVISVRPSPTAEMGHVVGLSFTRTSQVAADRLAEYCRVLLPARVAQVDWRPGGSINPALANAAHAEAVSADSNGTSPGANQRVSRISADEGAASSADAS